jgi:hypothetical protein
VERKEWARTSARDPDYAPFPFFLIKDYPRISKLMITTCLYFVESANISFYYVGVKEEFVDKKSSMFDLTDKGQAALHGYRQSIIQVLKTYLS